MKPARAASALKVQAVLGDGYRVVEFEERTATSAEAAAAIGCDIAQIAKSLVFQTKKTEMPVLVIASGANRVDEKALRDLLGEAVRRPDADFVRAATGFAIGGTPPVGHATALRTFLDRDLMDHETVWAAGGTPNAVFQVTPTQLRSLTGGTVADIAKR